MNIIKMDTQITVLIIIATLLLVCYMNQETNTRIDRENNQYIKRLISNGEAIIEGLDDDDDETFKEEIDEIKEDAKEEMDEIKEDIKEEIDELKKDMNDFEKKIKKSHDRCPHLGGKTKMIACVQYPPLNTGFLLSLCCQKCLNEIQSDFKKPENQHKYKFVKEGDDYYFHGEKGKQFAPKCTPENIKIVIKVTGNKL